MKINLTQGFSDLDRKIADGITTGKIHSNARNVPKDSYLHQIRELARYQGLTLIFERPDRIESDTGMSYVAAYLAETPMGRKDAIIFGETHTGALTAHTAEDAITTLENTLDVLSYNARFRDYIPKVDQHHEPL